MSVDSGFQEENQRKTKEAGGRQEEGRRKAGGRQEEGRRKAGGKDCKASRSLINSQ